MGDLVVQQDAQAVIFKELSDKITTVLSADINNIENSLVVANAITFLQEKLTPEVMKPIMALQGSKLGFKTDKDLVKNNSTGKYERGPGYPLDVVKNCFIEMSLIGLLPTSNEWNIIGGNSYVTKEGGTSLLKKQCKGLEDYTIKYLKVNQSDDKKTANVATSIKWIVNGKPSEEQIDFPVKSDPYTTFDALIGKAERKAKVWLYNKINGTNISDGDVMDIPHVEVSSKQNPTEVSEDKEAERVRTHISGSKDYATLIKCEKAIRENDTELWELFYNKMIEIAKTEDELKKVPNDWLLATDSFEKWDDRKREITKK